MQALLQTAQQMLQNIQAFLETSHATVTMHDAGSAAPHGAIAASEQRRRRRTRRVRSVRGTDGGGQATMAGAS
jgi:hypothetical protein